MSGSSTLPVYEIPLTPQSQQFNITLNGTQYQFSLTWREDDALVSNWVLDIYTGAGVPVVTGVPLVTGCNLLEQYQYLGLGFGLFVANDGNALLATPTFDNLGSTCHLLYVQN
jgi:hypothetical protein